MTDYVPHRRPMTESTVRKKINQRLFKRLILYYNVSVEACLHRQNIYKSRQRSISSP